MFDLISWGIGYTLSQSAEWFKGNMLFRADLVQALSEAAEKWNEELPKKYRMDSPATLFKPLENENLEDRLELKVLREQLREGQIPEPETWANAALEHIYFIRRKLAEPESEFWVTAWGKAAFGHIQSLKKNLANDVDPFYQADDEEIMPHLVELGRRLTLIIMQDMKTTLPLIYLKLNQLESKLDEISHRLDSISGSGLDNCSKNN